MELLKYSKQLIPLLSRFERGQKAVFPAATGLMVHALHKSASMFLFKFFDDLCSTLDVPLFSIHNTPPNENAVHDSCDESFVICPIRSLQIVEGVFSKAQNLRYLVQVRDPRDVLVSEYYSLGWLHSLDGWNEEARQRRAKIQETPIDQFVLAENLTGKASLLERMQPLPELLHHPSVTIVTYEEMVNDFPSWLSKVLGTLELEECDAFREQLVLKYQDEFLPTPSGGHKRKVTPGDHRVQLQPATIERLNEKFSSILNCMGYAK